MNFKVEILLFGMFPPNLAILPNIFFKISKYLQDVNHNRTVKLS